MFSKFKVKAKPKNSAQKTKQKQGVSLEGQIWKQKTKSANTVVTRNAYFLVAFEITHFEEKWTVWFCCYLCSKTIFVSVNWAIRDNENFLKVQLWTFGCFLCQHFVFYFILLLKKFQKLQKNCFFQNLWWIVFGRFREKKSFKEEKKNCFWVS